MTPFDLAQRIRRLRRHQPLSAKFDREITSEKAGRQRAWYSSQKEHCLGWPSDYDGPGGYNRKTWRGRDAEFIYNHIVNPKMLIWLAEAVGAPNAKVRRACVAALFAGATMQSMSAAIRRIFPFAEMEKLIFGGGGGGTPRPGSRR